MKTLSLWSAVLLLSLLPATAALAVCPDRVELKPGVHKRTVTVDGHKRDYLLYVPPSRAAGTPTPVVLNFHGGGQDAEKEMALSQMNATADKYGFLVVYPEGTAGLFGEFETWNAGSCCGVAVRKRVDDVAFTRAILDDLDRTLCIDDRRVFATGISNGSMMTYRLACELSDRIAAIAPVSGTIGISQCHPSRPVPVLHFHGTGDKFEPFQGGVGEIRSSGSFRSVPSTMAMFAKINRCQGAPQVALQKGDTTCRYFPHCEQDATVELCTIEGGGHTWPGGSPFPKGGKTTYDISANEVMWKFFEEHPLPK